MIAKILSFLQTGCTATLHQPFEYHCHRIFRRDGLGLWQQQLEFSFYYHLFVKLNSSQKILWYQTSQITDDEVKSELGQIFFKSRRVLETQSFGIKCLLDGI